MIFNTLETAILLLDLGRKNEIKKFYAHYYGEAGFWQGCQKFILCIFLKR